MNVIPPYPHPHGWRLEHSYAQLPPLFFKPWRLSPVPSPKLVVFNSPLAASLGLDPDVLDHPEAAPIFAGNALPPNAFPIAQAYAGHQFGNFTGLGDGRALLLGEQITPSNQRIDIQLKGAGRTPFSRGGDGRAALGPMLREFLISEAMAALGIPTTRSLAVASTGDQILRQDGLLPGAVLTRTAASHIRVGTFEWAAAHQDIPALHALVTYSIGRHYPHLVTASHPNPALALLEAVLERQAALIAQWMSVGFIHGVMNTDNMAISGETIDYGPCAFLDVYHPDTAFSSIDVSGRYAYANQPRIAHWNLTRFAEALLPVLAPDESTALDRANAALAQFPQRFQHHSLQRFAAKLGLITPTAADAPLVEDLLEWMQQTQSDFTNTFLQLLKSLSSPATLPVDPVFQSWHTRWRHRLASNPASPTPLAAAEQSMRQHNPRVIPRNHKVEEALGAAVQAQTLTPFRQLLETLSAPFSDSPPARPEYTVPAPPSARPYQTFCGT